MSDKAPSAPEKNAYTSKIAALAILIITVAVVYAQFGSSLSLNGLARHETELREIQQLHPVLVYGIAFLIYVMVTGLSLPGAAVLTLVYGWYFGFWRGFILVSFASTSGATVAFILSRFFFRDVIQQRFRERLQNFNQAFEKEGPFFLFGLRLIPAVPFFVINALMGLTTIRLSTFWWVSQLGMMPGTIVYVYAGAAVPSLQALADNGLKSVFTPSQLFQLLVAFAALGLFPLAVRGIMKYFLPPITNISGD